MVQILMFAYGGTDKLTVQHLLKRYREKQLSKPIECLDLSLVESLQLNHEKELSKEATVLKALESPEAQVDLSAGDRVKLAPGVGVSKFYSKTIVLCSK
jgi:hypothetical protein